MKRFGWLLFVVACAKAEPTVAPDDKPGLTPKAAEIAVEIAGVSLADDCADGVPTKPVPPPPTPASGSAAAGSSSMPSASMPAGISAGACADPSNCPGLPQPACEQTSMQLAITIPHETPETTMVVKKVELLDDAGKSLGTLTARAPSKWNGNAYDKWDERIVHAKVVHQVSYKLSSPDWNKLSGGRWSAASKKFSLRVTVTVSDKDRTIEKQSIVPIMPEPPVAT